ncbi:uncharacterized protein LOC141673488 [Apium graveolens]|uniref:uncharacterized protein LOC141673488 n=1 Tax=Apium graveolens TaxID=4045 RepID=UPI003D7A3BA0
MARALRDLKRKVEGDTEVGASATAFTKKLESTPRESGLKHFNFDSFDGLADPEEHLNYFEQISNIYDYSDLTRCRFFASTLKGGAQKWFSRIPSRSVDSWKDFCETFLKRFRANRMNELQMCHLETIQQRSKKSLPQFIKRFQEARSSEHLSEELASNILRSYAELRKNERKPKAKREPKLEPRADILREVKGKPFYYPPKPLLAPPENRAQDKHCGYHEDHGHTTENCFSLKMFIEDQIKKGNMNQYLQRRLNNKDRAPGSGKNMVNVVFGGTASPPRSPDPENEVMTIQPSEDEPIYFSYSDYEGLNPDHNLALVVTLDIADNEVKRILVDNNSSDNILFERTLNRMKLGHLRMDPC